MFPAVAFAAGGTDTAPTPSETTTVCEEGLIFDLATQTCMTPEESTNEDSAMMETIRELAHLVATPMPNAFWTSCQTSKMTSS